MENKDLKKLGALSKNFLQFETDQVMTWCGDCGNYGIQNAIKRAMTLEGLGRKDVVFVFDVGCNGNGADKIEGYTIHGLHGRAISLGAGCALANKDIKVITSAGDGATFSEGPQHLIHAIRNNYPMVFVFHNNENYGLTTGQASALSPTGAKRNGTPGVVTIPPLNPLQFVLSLDPSFVARSFSGEVNQMTDVFRAALKHDGFAFVEILQACPTYNKETPDHWYAERVKDVAELKDYDKTDIWQARKIVENVGEEFYTGVLYENKERASFFETQEYRKEWASLVDEVKPVDIGEFLEDL